MADTQEIAPPPVQPTPEVGREDRIRAALEAIQADPVNRDRALAEVHVMLTELHALLGQAFAMFENGGGGLGLLKSLLRR